MKNLLNQFKALSEDEKIAFMKEEMAEMEMARHSGSGTPSSEELLGERCRSTKHL